jgi:P27 family predicted phage terminase small subunit
MGRRKTPNALLEKRGSKKTRDEPEARDGEVNPTFHLPPEGKKAWERIRVEMDAMGTLSPAFADFMTIAAGAVGNIEISSRDLIERGHISVTERGETKNPSFTILTSSQQIAHRYLSALGLSPTSIGNLTRKKTEDTNPFEDLMNE